MYGIRRKNQLEGLGIGPRFGRLRSQKAGCPALIVMIVKIGIQTRSLRQPLRQALVTSARLGAEGVEIDARNELRPSELSRTGLREFNKLLEDLNLRVAAVAFPTRRGYGDADDLERRVLATQEAMRFAAALRTDVVVNRIGRVGEKPEDPDFRRLAEALTAIGNFGERIGVRLAAQTADANPHDLARILAELPEHSLGVDLHPNGLIVAGYSPREAVELLGPNIVYVHACDAVRDASSRRTNEVELGRGSADIPEILGTLAEFNYRGWMTIERRDSPNPAVEIENGIAFLRNL
jgi:sugar phosphate isomerase/epimerase